MTGDPQVTKRKRIRIPKSCIPCLKGKRACDRGRPACGRCARSGQSDECIYDSRLADKGGEISRPTKLHKQSNSNPGSNADSDADPSEVARLKSELDAIKRQNRQLQDMLRPSQHPYHDSSSSSSSRLDQKRGTRSGDLDAVSGLQMLAEMAGPSHGNRPSLGNPSSIASVLNWPEDRTARLGAGKSSGSPSSSSTAAASNPAPGSLRTDTGLSPIDTRSHLSSAISGSLHPPAAFEDHSQDSRPPRNLNGTFIYYGEGAHGNTLLSKVAEERVDQTRKDVADGEQFSDQAQAQQRAVPQEEVSALKRDVQTAFNGLLDPSREVFPFATIWSSGDKFLDEILPYFPSPDEFDSLCQSFVRHFSSMCPALTVPHAINQAREFSRLSREEQARVSLPWLAVFLMICAMGKNCDLENITGSLERQIEKSDLLHSADASQVASASSSPRPDTLQRLDSGRISKVRQASRSAARISDIYLSATYQCLRLCSFLSSPTLQTIHAQLLIGSYLLNTERAASFWPLLGSIARQAQSIGLHVDPYKIRPDWDSVEADIRRRLWWATVHVDVILSGIFGRPLGITRFSSKFPSAEEPNARNYATLQCEFSQFSRIYLDENQDNSWSQEQIDAFTEKVTKWYSEIPPQYRAELGLVDPHGSAQETEAFENYQVAGVDLNTKGLMEVQQSCHLAIEMWYAILYLHRSNLLSNLDRQESEEGSNQVNETSLGVCAKALRCIARAQQTMIEMLGRARASMFWKISYYTYQAAVAGAYIVFLKPTSRYAESALQDLRVLSDVFDRMPDRWVGLKMAKGGLRVLHTLAVAARENPMAASMLRNPQAMQPVTVMTPLPAMADGDSLGVPSSTLATSFQATPNKAAPPQPSFAHLFQSHGPSTPFMLPIFQNSPGRIGTPTPAPAAFNVDHFMEGGSGAASLKDHTHEFLRYADSPSLATAVPTFESHGLPPPTLDQALATYVQPNQKDMANYWSEYFSLQLDWDRLNSLS